MRLRVNRGAVAAEILNYRCKPAALFRQFAGQNIAQNFHHLARLLGHRQRRSVHLFQRMLMLWPMQHNQRFAKCRREALSVTRDMSGLCTR